MKKFIALLSLSSLLVVGMIGTPTQHNRTFGGICVANAQDELILDHGAFHDIYKNWRTPPNQYNPEGGPPGSCCRMRVVDKDGNITGDCYQTEYRQLPGGNYEALTKDGHWIIVPIKDFIKEHNPDPTGQTIAICESHQYIYCAVEPEAGF